MYCYKEIKITPKTLSFVADKKGLLDFLEEVEKKNVSIEVCRHFLSKSDEFLTFELSNRRVDSICFGFEELPKKNLDAFLKTTKNNPRVTLTLKSNGNNDEVKITFKISS